MEIFRKAMNKSKSLPKAKLYPCLLELCDEQIAKLSTRVTMMANPDTSSLGRYVFGSEISYNKPPPRLPGLAYLIAQSRKKSWDIEFQKILDYEFQKIVGH